MSNKIKCTIVNGSNKVFNTLVFEANIIISTMTDYTISNHTVATSTINVVEPTNKLKDENGNDRYTFLFNGYSSYSGIEYCVYYDTQTNEAFIINNVDYIDVVNGNMGNVNLYGYKLGTDYHGNNGDGLNMTIGLNDVKLPTPTNSLAKVDVIQLNLHGITTRFTFMDSKTLDTNQSGYIGINLNTFIKVDKNKLFGSDALIPLVGIHPSTMIKFNTSYLGKKNTDYIYIPIPV